MSHHVQLCEYCTQINFDQLLHPTVAEIQAIETSRNPENPAHNVPSGSWNLGLQSRIKVSAASCRLCYAICELVRQQPRIKRHWESHSWSDPACFCNNEAAATLGPRPGTSWVDNIGLGLSRLQLGWHNEGGADELSRPGHIPGRHPSNSVLLVDAFQTCSRVAPKLVTQGLFNDSNLSPEDIPFGGRVRPALVDMNLPARWLEECLGNHMRGCGHFQQVELEESVPELRLIDVKSQTVAKLSNVNISKLEYIALSYVWGKGKQATLTTKNLSKLQQPGSLRSAGLPQTIQDVMVVTKRLGFQYVWVDSLCIVQDDEDDKALQIGQMSSIYSRAVLTIVAAAGDSSDAGLPGVSSARPSEQIEVALPRTSIRPSRSLLSTFSGRRGGEYIYLTPYRNTTWNSRGWTHQEYILSARVLIFMEHHVLWECGTCSWTEETHCETDIARVSWLADTYVPRSEPSRSLDSNIWSTVLLEIANYQERRLTNEGDALDAFDGFLSQIEKISGQTFIWGMPVSIFHSSVSYWPTKMSAPVRRTCLTTRRVTALKRKVPFPSWSWLGWTHQFADIVSDEGGHREQPGTGIHGNAYFVLKNSPLRLEPIGLHELPALPLSLDDVISSSSQLSCSRFEDIPDTQYICFRAQIIRLSDAKPVQLDDVKDMPVGTTFFTADDTPFMVSELVRCHLSNTIYKDEFIYFDDSLANPDRWNRVIIDKESHRRIGISATCAKHPGSKNVTKGPILVYAKCEGKHITAFEVIEEQGVFYKVNVARIERSHWFDAASRLELVVMG